MKYDFALDLYTDNANADIIARIEDGSRVLEFGPANGRMTQYLYEQKKCCIDIVEIDEVAGKNAALYANEACLGKEWGNINDIQWQKKLEGNQYDAIIFADVLEHLLNPREVLKRCSHFLSTGGKILCSIPNIAHASIILGLINGKFSYTSTGLLDNTHIYFFTEESFGELVRESGYYISYEHAILGRVGTIEQPYLYDMVGKDVERTLKNRINNEAYQYVFELKRGIYNQNVKRHIDTIPPQVGIAKCYIMEDCDSDFCEQKCIIQFLNSQNPKLEFDISYYKNVSSVRLQLIDTNSIIVLKYIGQEMDRRDFRNDCVVNGYWINEDTIYSVNEPINISWKISKEEKINGKINISYDIILYNSDAMNWIGCILDKTDTEKKLLMQELDIKKNLIQELEIKKNLIQELEIKKNLLQELEVEKNLLVQELETEKDLMQELETEKNSLVQKLEIAKRENLEMKKSISWKITEPLRKIAATIINRS